MSEEKPRLQNSKEVDERREFGKKVLEATNIYYDMEGVYLKDLILSGDPEQVYGRCGASTVSEAVGKLRNMTGREIVRVTSSHDSASGHYYMFDEKGDEVIDPTAGQFIPSSSRQGHEEYFLGNMYIGPRSVLREIVRNGVVNTTTKDDPQISFERIWGNEDQVLVKPITK